ncbi:hypothetical protein GJ496_010903, partial [Pomphorhynchus laevis]
APIARTLLRRLSSISERPDYRKSLIDLLIDPYVISEIWNHVIWRWKEYGEIKSNCFKELIYSGMPTEFRQTVWSLLVANHSSDELHKSFHQYLQNPCEFDDIIELDVPRTFPDVVGFSEDDNRLCKSLFNVVKAYSMQDKEVGYCQGVAFLAGLLLMHMDENDAFVILVKIMNNYKLRDLYKPDMIQFGVWAHQFEGLLKRLLPALYCHLTKNDFGISVICSHFLTMMCNILPLPAVFHLLDIVLIDGFEIIPKSVLAILKLNEQRLIHSNLEELLKFFHNDLKHIYADDHTIIIKELRNICFDDRLMNRLKKEYIFKSQKQARMMNNMESLREENLILKQKVYHLEQENVELAEFLLNLQIQYSNANERKESLQDENEILKESLDIQRIMCVNDNQKATTLKQLSSITTSGPTTTMNIHSCDSGIDFKFVDEEIDLTKFSISDGSSCNDKPEENIHLEVERDQLKERLRWVEHQLNDQRDETMNCN